MKIKNPPEAANLIASARSQGGYTLASALADLFDNSIDHQSSVIRVDTVSGTTIEDYKIVIHDNGTGMSEKHLIRSMRPASQHPDEERNANALGRFGWGMKSASLSQARKLVVISSDGHDTSLASWDSQNIGDWEMDLLTGQDAIEHLLTKPDSDTWTQLQWHLCDRLTDGYVLSETDLDEMMADAIEELELIFHRFIADKDRPLEIIINGRPLIPADPFLEEISAKISDENETIECRGTLITYTGYTLPHFGTIEKKLRDKLDRGKGMIGNQGFYVYREKRLIIHGTWLGIEPYKALHQLVRVRLDIPNSLDNLFKITIDKSDAQLPLEMKHVLRNIIRNLRKKSVAVIQGPRKPKTSATASDSFWKLTPGRGQSRFLINREHPLFNKKQFDAEDMETLLTLVESSIPLNVIQAELTKKDTSVCNRPVEPEQVTEIMQQTIRLLRLANPEYSEEDIRRSLVKFDFFEDNPAILDDVLDGDANNAL